MSRFSTICLFWCRRIGMDGGGELTHHGNKKFDVNSVLQPEIQELYLSVPIFCRQICYPSEINHQQKYRA